jgi:hypothetical protein
MLALVGLCLLVGACTGAAVPSDGVLSLASVAPGASATSSASAEDPQQAALDYAQCMRDHGVAMADPQIITNGAGGKVSGGITIGGSGAGGAKVDPNAPAFAAAQTTCQHFLAGITQVAGGKQLTAAQQSAFLAFAQCMRDHGVNMPDPQLKGGGVRIQISAGSGTSAGQGIDPNSPAFAAAQTACQTILTDAGVNGPGTRSSDGGSTTSSGGGAGPSGQP